jgi:3-oxoadipate enol-lactonase
MAFVNTNSGRIYYRLEGRDGAPVVVFAHSLGCDHGQWDRQSADLQAGCLVLRYDLRGHGASEATPGDYSIELLARDVLALADSLGIHRFAFCGLSIGGMIGQRLGASAGDRLTRLILANTSARLADPTIMETRRAAVLKEGMSAVAETSLGRFFSPEAIAGGLPHVATTRRTMLATNPVGYACCCAAIRDMDQIALLGRIRVPTLVISSDCDPSTPWKGNGEVLEKSIPGAKAVHLKGAHLSNLEQPGEFTRALMDFLTQ